MKNLKSIDFITSNKNIKNEIFNLGNNAPISTLQLLSCLELKLKKKSKIIRKYTTTESSYTHADIAKAQNILGYGPKVGFKKGIDKFLEWHEKNKI